MNWCTCGTVAYGRVVKDLYTLVCSDCGETIRCEFSGMDDDSDEVHAATCTHVDYSVCDKHYDVAVDNVSSR